MNLEQLGLLGVFLAGATPWIEAVVVIPAGLLFGLDPVWVVVSAMAGNAITIFLFAYLGSAIREWFRSRRKPENAAKPDRFAKAQKLFDSYGIYGLALVSPILVGTQFAAAVAVAAGVKPLRTSVLITLATTLWAVGIAALMLIVGLDQITRSL
jgi:membrane protein YqaA with SNARE-associated domain